MMTAGFWRHRGGLVAGLVVAYTLGVLFQVWQSPLGRAPQLDSAELLALARGVAEGGLAAEPFYRAMGYPALLAIFVPWFGSTTGLAGVALLLGALAHLLNTWLVGRLAERLWGASGGVRLLATVLYGLNPVVLFFSVDVLDMAVGLSGALGALVLLTRPGRPEVRAFLGAGLLLGWACVVRPHFFFLLPGVAAWVVVAGQLRRPSAGWLLVGLLVSLAIQSAAGWRVSGEWRWMPWQGSFNLYAANEAGANGKYFTQRVVVTDRDVSVNPARAESEVLYAQATGEAPPFDISAMNAHWRAAFWAQLRADPLGWLGLMGRKTYYLFNDFEQYNNKTYAFHASERPLLRWNPLSWGVLFVLGVGAFALGGRRSGEGGVRRGLLVVVVLAAAYAGSLLAFYVSARFRMPLHAALAVLAAGWPVVWIQGTACHRRMVALLMAAVGGVTFSGFFQAAATDTFVQDRMLLANAAAEVGEDAEAWQRAESVWQSHPTRWDAHRLALLSFFNERLGRLERGQPPAWEAGTALALAIPPGLAEDPALSFAQGVVRWNLGHHAEAIRLWKASVEHSGAVTAANATQALAVVRGESPQAADLPPIWRQLLPPAL